MKKAKFDTLGNPFRFRILHAVLSRSIRILNIILHYLEEFTCPSPDIKLEYPPIFIIGAPRSGSTLLFQTLINCYEFTHLTNVHNKFYGAIGFIERWFGPSWKRGGVGKYESYYGLSKGRWAPSECGEFWYRWFRRFPPYTRRGEISNVKLKCIRRVVASLGIAGERPILFKNLYCSLRLQPLAQAFPEGLFIVIKRNPIRIASSILTCRKKVNGNYCDWWSVPPPEYGQLKHLSPPLQVMGQIKAIYRLIESDAKQIDVGRFLNVSYESFCANTPKELKYIEDFLISHGLKLKQHNDVPMCFPLPNENIGSSDHKFLKELEKVAKMDLELILNASI